MGEYFILVNEDKKEYICPHCINGLAKLWEWCSNQQGSILAFLVAKSDSNSEIAKYKYAGHWAGDRILLVGDYDSSGLYHKAKQEYKNISIEVAKEFYDYIHEHELIKNLSICKGCKLAKQERYKKINNSIAVITALRKGERFSEINRIIIQQLFIQNPSFLIDYGLKNIIQISEHSIRLNCKNNGRTINIDIIYDYGTDLYNIDAYEVNGETAECKKIASKTGLFWDMLDKAIKSILEGGGGGG